MKQNHSIFIGWQGVILALAVILYGVLESAYCQGPASQPFAERQPRIDATVLLLQQTNPEAGTVTPEAGIHHFDLNTEVTLTAIPKPSYYFVYWIGDVSDPTANSTIVYLDAPKIVIAVFERSEYEFTLEEKKLQNTLGGGGRRYGSAPDYSKQGYSGGGGKRPSKPDIPPGPGPGPGPPGPEPLPDEFPIPAHAPEPATLLLLGLGGLLFVRRRTKR